jgi:hypothetical protein
MQVIAGFTTKEILFIAIGASFAIFANMIALVIVGQINEKVSPDQKVSYLGWSSRIRKQHRQLYPESKLVLLFDICIILMFVCFFGFCWFLLSAR